MKRKHDIASTVPALLGYCCPPAICWAVIAVGIWIAVNAVVGRWTTPHVSQEGDKRLPPAAANADAPATVKEVIVMIRVSATSNDMLPCLVLRETTQSMRGVASNKTFRRQASATANPAIAKMVAADVLLGAAVAEAKPPSWFVRLFAKVAQDSQSAEPTPRQVFELAVSRDRMECSHDAPFVVKGPLWLDRERGTTRAPVTFILQDLAPEEKREAVHA